MKAAVSSKPVDTLSKAEAKAELQRLATAIARHDELYYRQDAPEISDAEYDGLRARHAAIEARFPALRRADSPSERVGAAPVEAFGKVRHEVATALIQGGDQEARHRVAGHRDSEPFGCAGLQPQWVEGVP